MPWKGIMHPLPQRLLDFHRCHSTILSMTTKWRKKTSMQRNLWRKKCLAMPYHSKNTTNILVCSRFRHFSQSEDLQQINTSIFDIYSYHIYLFLRFDAFVKVIRLTPLRHDDLQPLGACHFCSIKQVISLERDANRELQSAVQHLAESSPSASKLPRFFAKGRNVRKKTLVTYWEQFEQ